MEVDYLLLGGSVYDGLGKAPVVADVAISSGRILAVGPSLNSHYTSTHVYDLSGLSLSPGFIDTHAHDDTAALSPSSSSSSPHPLLPKLSQGVTSVIVGNCGISAAPSPASPCTCSPPSPSACSCPPLPTPMYILGPRSAYAFPTVADYVRTLNNVPKPINVGILLGHGSLRLHVMPNEEDVLSRPASEDETKAMVALIQDAIDDGDILGLSTGLYYPTGSSAPTQEVVALARPVGDAGGVYATHMRDEAGGVEDALEEAISISEATGASLIVSHVKAAGKANWGKGEALRKRLERAAAAAAQEGQEERGESTHVRRVAFDVYPYTASSTHLSAPHVSRSSSSLLAWSDAVSPDHFGQEIMDVAESVLGTPQGDVDAAVSALSPGGGIYFQISEDDLDTLMTCEHCMVGSDGLPLDSHPHPRLYGTFARALAMSQQAGRPLEETIRRMTSLPAQVFGLTDRGTLTVGAYADLVVFDPTQVADTATYTEPRQLASGITYVFVNGELVYDAPSSPGSVLSFPGIHLSRPSSTQVERMNVALASARAAATIDEVPVGAAFFDTRDGSLVASSHNATIATRNTTYHAELLALGALEVELGSLDALRDLAPHLELYVTLEPCGMCYSALRQLGLAHIYYGAANPRFGGATVLGLNVTPPIIPMTGGVCRDQAVSILKQFYAQENPAALAFHQAAAANGATAMDVIQVAETK